MCNYTYLIKYYDLCGRRAEASREEGQKTVFEMQGAAEQRDAEMSGGEMWQLTRVASKGGVWWRVFFCCIHPCRMHSHSPLCPLTQRAEYRTFNRSEAPSEML